MHSCRAIVSFQITTGVFKFPLTKIRAKPFLAGKRTITDGMDSILFFRLTMLRPVAPNMVIYCEEIFFS